MSNTIDSNLIPAHVADGIVQVLSNRLAPLAAFTTAFSTSQLRPLATVDVKKANAGPTVQTNATNFESGNTTINAVQVTVAQYTASWHITNAEGSQGFSLSDGAGLAAVQLADKISDVVTALMVTTNGYGTLTVGIAANFDSADLPAVMAAAKNYRSKNLLLDGTYMAYLLPKERTNFTPGEPGAYGLDGLWAHSRWAGAEANACGFCCDPSTICVAAGLPAPMPKRDIRQGLLTLPGLNLTVAVHEWFARATRTRWASLDVMFGANFDDAANTGKILVSA